MCRRRVWFLFRSLGKTPSFRRLYHVCIYFSNSVLLYRYGHPVRLLVEAIDEYKYAFSAASAANPAHVKQLGYRNATIVSGGSGPFTGE